MEKIVRLDAKHLYTYVIKGVFLTVIVKKVS
jgi:hypothetical protein